MENNIFLQSKNKFNPDISSKLQTKDNERKTTKIIPTTTIYNPITGVVPQKIRNSNDLILEKEKVIKVNDIRKSIRQKEEERKLQEQELKPVKQKITNKPTQNNYLQTFNEMKGNAVQRPKNEQKNNNILDGLKDLGIIRR